MIQRDLYCQTCGTRFTIWRRNHRLREKGYIKDLWRIKCKKVTKHTESEV